MRSKRAGFNLVELMVVLGILALLLPFASQLGESARRAKCAANLENMGAAAHAFANRHNGHFPMLYRMRDTNSLAYPYYTPFVFPQADKLSVDLNPYLWTVFGTSWQEWQSCGLTLGSISCPSSTRVAVAQDLSASNPEWGSVIWSTYMYVGGLTSYNIASSPYQKDNYQQCSTPHWGTAEPAVMISDSALSQKILAADMVFYSGGTPQQPVLWDRAGRWVINHAAKDQLYDAAAKQWAPMPDFQNILYGDGRVAPRLRDDFPFVLNSEITARKQDGNFSMVQGDPKTIGGYMYWGEGDAIPKPVRVPVIPNTAKQVLHPEPPNGWPFGALTTKPPPYTPPSNTAPSNPVCIPGT